MKNLLKLSGLAADLSLYAGLAVGPTKSEAEALMKVPPSYPAVYRIAL
ncbi:hypothetical protein [Pseudomonas brassicacearum]|nr:hypothetical protein [Pseudomonas brassicacearum]